MELLEEEFEELGDAIGTGEYEPVVRVQFEQRVHEILTTSCGLDFDGREFENFGAAFVHREGELTGLSPSAGSDHAFAEQCPALEPIQLVAKPHYLADDRHCRRTDLFPRVNFADV